MEIPEEKINEIIDIINDLIEIIDSNEAWEMCPLIHKIRNELGKYSLRQQKRDLEMGKLYSYYSEVFQSKENINLKQLKL